MTAISRDFADFGGAYYTFTIIILVWQFRWWYASENKKGTEGYEEAVQYTGLRESLIAIATTEKNHGWALVAVFKT